MPTTGGARAHLLARVPLFAGLSKRQLARVAAVAVERSSPGGQVLVESGDPGNAIFVIVSGKVRVMKGRKTEAELGPGDFFGELALLDGQARTRTVVATTSLQTIRIQRPAFLRLLRREPDVAVSLLERMAQRTRAIMDSPSN